MASFREATSSLLSIHLSRVRIASDPVDAASASSDVGARPRGTRNETGTGPQAPTRGPQAPTGPQSPTRGPQRRHRATGADGAITKAQARGDGSEAAVGAALTAYPIKDGP